MKTTLETYFDFLQKSKSTDDGAKGKALEVAIRAYIQPRSRRVGVTSNKTWYGDVRLKSGNSWEKIEIKSSCGELALVQDEDADAESMVYRMLPKADYIMYCPEISDAIPLEDQTFVFTRESFIEMVTTYSGRGAIIRVKESTSGGHRLSFQSFRSDTRPKASKPIAEHIWNACYEQPTVKEWMENERV